MDVNDATDNLIEAADSDDSSNSLAGIIKFNEI